MWGEAIPKLERKIAVCGCKCADKVVFERLYGAFSCIHLVVVWLDQHQFTLFRGETLFDYIACLIIYHVKLDGKTF